MFEENDMKIVICYSFDYMCLSLARYSLEYFY